MSKELNALVKKLSKKSEIESKQRIQKEEQLKRQKGCFECNLSFCYKCEDCKDVVLRVFHNF
jgi:hypothetical protein